MKRLEDTFNKTITAGININSKEIISSRDAKETINNIVKEIETNKNITENEAKVIYYNFERGKTEINPSSALVYLASKLLVKKLNEILDAIKSAYY
jgi:type II restriction/modification system DNA methylase subunit YeeA